MRPPRKWPHIVVQPRGPQPPGCRRLALAHFSPPEGDGRPGSALGVNDGEAGAYAAGASRLTAHTFNRVAHRTTRRPTGGEIVTTITPTPTVSFVVKLVAKPETADEVAAFVAGAIELANGEAGTV